jgi:dipeptidyl aminopeptidase/acylaminoacyl peptidase
VLGTGAGGYAALLTAVENPDRYACVVSHDGFSDLRTMKAYYTLLFNTDASVAMLGDASDAELDMHSPMRRAAELKVPVLLVHSKEAPIPAQQSEAMDRALRRVRIEHEFLELDNDSRDTELKYLTVLDTFLGKHLH